MRGVLLPIHFVPYDDDEEEQPSFSYCKYLWWYFTRVMTLLGFIVLILEGLNYYYCDQEAAITPPTTPPHPDEDFELLSDADSVILVLPIPSSTTTIGYESLETQIPNYNEDGVGERDRAHDCPDIEHHTDRHDADKILANPGQTNKVSISKRPPLPNLLDDPKAQIKLQIKRSFGKLSARCTEYGTEKSDTVECQRAEKTFETMLKGLQEEMVVVGFECNFTLQMDPELSPFGALWSNETCITAEENGNVYYESNLMTYKRVLTTLSNPNFSKVRTETEIWCECLKTWAPLVKGFGYRIRDKEECFKFIGASKATRAFVAGKGVRCACKPAEVLLEYISWKQDDPEPEPVRLIVTPIWQYPDYN